MNSAHVGPLPDLGRRASESMIRTTGFESLIFVDCDDVVSDIRGVSKKNSTELYRVNHPEDYL